MKEKLKTLIIETGCSPSNPTKFQKDDGILDYSIYSVKNRLLRRIEQLIRLDIMLALEARKVANSYDVVWAFSEKVGIPLSFMRIKKPIVTVCQHMASPEKRWFLKLIGVTKKWAGIAYISDADRDFLVSYYGVPESKLIRCVNAPINRFTPSNKPTDTGVILSLGVSKRDYKTLVAALRELPGYTTEIYLSSRYGDKYLGKSVNTLPKWVQIKERVTDAELIQAYRDARFVVLSLIDTTQFSAGASVALEASSSGKAIIATNTRGMKSFVDDGVTGLLVPPNDEKALRNAIDRLWNNSNLAKKMGEAGRKYVEKNFNPKLMNEELKQFLQ